MWLGTGLLSQVTWEKVMLAWGGINWEECWTAPWLFLQTYLTLLRWLFYFILKANLAPFLFIQSSETLEGAMLCRSSSPESLFSEQAGTGIWSHVQLILESGLKNGLLAPRWVTKFTFQDPSCLGSRIIGPSTTNPTSFWDTDFENCPISSTSNLFYWSWFRWSKIYLRWCFRMTLLGTQVYPPEHWP